MLAMFVNDNACLLGKRGALESIASNRASTGCSYKIASVLCWPSALTHKVGRSYSPRVAPNQAPPYSSPRQLTSVSDRVSQPLY